MNVTKKEIKYRKPQREGYLEKNSMEHERYSGAYASSRITENNTTNENLSGNKLLEEILDRNNMNKLTRK